MYKNHLTFWNIWILDVLAWDHNVDNALTFLWSIWGFHMCFPHIYMTWAGHTGILTTTQVYLLTRFHILYLLFFVLSVWDDDVIHNRCTSAQSALALPFLSSEVRTCSAEKQSKRERERCSLWLRPSCERTDRDTTSPLHWGPAPAAHFLQVHLVVAIQCSFQRIT